MSVTSAIYLHCTALLAESALIFPRKLTKNHDPDFSEIFLGKIDRGVLVHAREAYSKLDRLTDPHVTWSVSDEMFLIPWKVRGRLFCEPASPSRESQATSREPRVSFCEPQKIPAKKIQKRA